MAVASGEIKERRENQQRHQSRHDEQEDEEGVHVARGSGGPCRP